MVELQWAFGWWISEAATNRILNIKLSSLTVEKLQILRMSVFFATHLR